MPELPEVETIRRQLAPSLTGRALVGAWAFPHPKFLPATAAVGTAVTGVDRAGKYLLVRLDDGRDLVVHLGMTGSLRIREPDDPGDAYVRATWTLDHEGGPALEYRDVRRFGRLAVALPRDHVGTLAVQGPDALDPGLRPTDLHRALTASRRAIKTQLLSQKPLAGVGNIYADEALWRARVHPAARTISRPKAAALLDAIREVLQAGIDNGGTTLRDYRTVDGEPGQNQFHLQAYGQSGTPCPRCGTELRRLVLDARSTTFCPRCQRR